MFFHPTPPQNLATSPLAIISIINDFANEGLSCLFKHECLDVVALKGRDECCVSVGGDVDCPTFCFLMFSHVESRFRNERQEHCDKSCTPTIAVNMSFPFFDDPKALFDISHDDDIQEEVLLSGFSESLGIPLDELRHCAK